MSERSPRNEVGVLPDEGMADGTRGLQWHGGTYLKPGLFYNGRCLLPWPLAATWRYRRLHWWWPF